MEKLKRVKEICEEYGITNYTINEDGTVDVDGSVSLEKMGLTKLPLKFGKVVGYFSVYKNKLTSLDGCPKEVGEYFDCAENQLTSLEGCPEFVGTSFWCCDNQLESLKGCPKEIRDDFYCQYNKLTSLEEGPEFFHDFICFGNPLPKEAIDNPKSYIKRLNRDKLINEFLTNE